MLRGNTQKCGFCPGADGRRYLIMGSGEGLYNHLSIAIACQIAAKPQVRVCYKGQNGVGFVQNRKCSAQKGGFSAFCWTFPLKNRFLYLDWLVIRNSSLTNVAWSCGYYDLAHMTSDFRDICGFSPSELIRHGKELTETFGQKFSGLMKKKIKMENLT